MLGISNISAFSNGSPTSKIYTLGEKTILPFHDIRKSWQMLFSKAPTTTILEIDHAVQRFHQKDCKLIYNQGMAPIEVTAASGSLLLFKWLERKVLMKTPQRL